MVSGAFTTQLMTGIYGSLDCFQLVLTNKQWTDTPSKPGFFSASKSPSSEDVEYVAGILSTWGIEYSTIVYPGANSHYMDNPWFPRNDPSKMLDCPCLFTRFYWYLRVFTGIQGSIFHHLPSFSFVFPRRTWDVRGAHRKTWGLLCLSWRLCQIWWTVPGPIGFLAFPRWDDHTP